jgi:hypothetical protein
MLVRNLFTLLHNLTARELLRLSQQSQESLQSTSFWRYRVRVERYAPPILLMAGCLRRGRLRAKYCLIIL